MAVLSPSFIILSSQLMAYTMAGFDCQPSLTRLQKTFEMEWRNVHFTISAKKELTKTYTPFFSAFPFHFFHQRD
jgi:hypothetical protein